MLLVHRDFIGIHETQMSSTHSLRLFGARCPKIFVVGHLVEKKQLRTNWPLVPSHQAITPPLFLLPRNAQCHITTSNECAEIGGLTTIDGAHQHQTGQDGTLSTDQLGQNEGQTWHNAIAGDEIDGHCSRAFQALPEVINRCGDTN